MEGCFKVPRAAGQEKLRKGFKVNTQYRGARSYGTISQEELEEAARIRNEYNEDLSSVKKADVKPKARRRLLLKRLRPSFQALDEEDEDDTEDQEETGEKSGDGDGDDSEASSSWSSTATVGAAATPLRELRTSWLGWPSPMELSASRNLAQTLTTPGASRVSGRTLQAAARALYEANDMVKCALTLRELRDFGVDREVLERRLDVSDASDLFDEVAVRLGVVYLDAGLWRDAWEALMGACAQPRLAPRWRKAALSALADAAERGANASDAWQQVELLQGVLDAEAVLSALPRDRREGLEIYMALSLQKMGRQKDSREILTRLAQGGSSARREQAEWALMVQDAEVSGNAEGQEMRKIWDEAPSPALSAMRGGRGTAKIQNRQEGVGRSVLDGAAPMLATLFLALPLAVVPLLLIKGR
mgnify:CR=1 FL=1